MVGLYGVTSLATLARTREIGVRIALGARRVDVLTLVLGRGVRMAFAGTLIGVIAGVAGTRLLASRLHGVGAADLVSFAGGATCLLIAALAASAIPVIRASRVDPMSAIREE